MAVRTMSLRDAVDLAVRAHEGSLDRGGRPYIEHPLRVMVRVARRHDLLAVPLQLLDVPLAADDVPLCMAAALHDVLEDTPVTAEDLRAAGCPPPVVDAVVALSRRPGEPYLDYVARAAADPIGRYVKWADIEDNSDPARLALLRPDEAERLGAKYAQATRDLSEWIYYWRAVSDVAAHPDGFYRYYRNHRSGIGLMRQWRWRRFATSEGDPAADAVEGWASWPEYIHPESTGGRWRPGSAYELDAVTGMGEDMWSVGEGADVLTPVDATRFAAELGVRLDAPRCREWPPQN